MLEEIKFNLFLFFLNLYKAIICFDFMSKLIRYSLLALITTSVGCASIPVQENIDLKNQEPIRHEKRIDLTKKLTKYEDPIINYKKAEKDYKKIQEIIKSDGVEEFFPGEYERKIQGLKSLIELEKI